MSVSLLPESRSACVYISVSLQVSFSFTGTIGIVSWQCDVLIPAFVTGTCEEFPVTFTDYETETFWGSAPPLVTPDWPSTLVLPVEEAPPLATPTWPSTLVLPAGLCKRVLWGPLHTSQATFFEHCDFKWSLPRQSKHNLFCIQKGNLGFVKNFLKPPTTLKWML